ncbi:NADPH-dependent oxidoreductase [Listeria grandensis]|uniref:NADPH-dependent oxidoreductase n=1 Tax=Listeria grandensis TaxID=1494963 RepID=UPI001625CA97|nr:NADPH-dependent oxidoreductase [Listeria grandensis]MBC1475224.1 NADPH-dependent oxidoreductase [Listeria grandensis]
MNPIIDHLRNHRSFRKFKKDQPIPKEQLNAIVRSAQSAPSWINGQQYSIIAIQNPERKQKMAELCGNQAYIAESSVFLVFVADFYRAQLASQQHGGSLSAAENIDALLVGATDVGLACENAIIAAESLELGVVCIGGIRRNMAEVIDFLQLPKHVFPVVGLCVGYPDVEMPIKPRLPKEAIYFEETYQSDVAASLAAYDETIIPFSTREGGISWTKRVSAFYDKDYYPSIAEALKKQGFVMKDL